MHDVHSLLEPLRQLHGLIRKSVVDSCERATLEELSRVAREEEGDTIFAVDRVSEDLLVEFFEQQIAPVVPVLLVAEGWKGERLCCRGRVLEERLSCALSWILL